MIWLKAKIAWILAGALAVAAVALKVAMTIAERRKGKIRKQESWIETATRISQERRSHDADRARASLERMRKQQDK